MGQFLKKLFYFILFGIFALVSGPLLPTKSKIENLHYSIFDKHALLRITQEPSIIIAGGSNASFGIYSQILKDSFDLPVVNTAIHAGYGLKYIIDDISPYIKSGDIVILAPEYSQFTGNTFYGEKALLHSISIFPANIRKLSFYQLYLQIGNYINFAINRWPAYFSSLLNSDQNIERDGVYNRNSFNKFGDVIAHWEKPNHYFANLNLDKDDINCNVFQYISKFQSETQTKGAEFLLTFSCLNESSYQNSQKAINEIFEGIKQHNIHYVGSPEDMMFTDSLFFNSPYHLNKRGQILRTEILRKQIKTMIN